VNHRASGLPIDALRLIPRRICVGVGGTKAAILRAALVAGAVTDLVIDDGAAELLVEDADSS
jgi:deoxyribonucleoside regulator